MNGEQDVLAKNPASEDDLAKLQRRRAEHARSRDEYFASFNSTPHSREVPTAPLILRIEVVNLCNANCVFCTYQFQTRKTETMSFDTFKDAVDQYAAAGGKNLSFAPVVGEALVDKNLEEKVAYARGHAQFERFEIWSNGILLTRERFEALVRAGMDEFHIAMSGFSADEYKKIYRNSGYEKVLRNLTDIAQSPLVKSVKFVVWSRTSSADPSAEPDYIKLREIAEFPIIFENAMFSWHGQITQEDLQGEMFIVEGPKDQSRPCFHMWTAFTVMSDGEMTMCGCTDRDGAGLPLGNIRDVPIDAHLRDGRWEAMRDSFANGNPPEFCRGCDMYLPVTLADA